MTRCSCDSAHTTCLDGANKEGGGNRGRTCNSWKRQQVPRPHGMDSGAHLADNWLFPARFMGKYDRKVLNGVFVIFETDSELIALGGSTFGWVPMTIWCCRQEHVEYTVEILWL